MEYIDVEGFRLRNKDKILQIDGKYSNMELAATGTLTMNSDFDGVLGRYVDITPPSGRTNPIIAVRSEEGVYVKRMQSGVFRVYSGSTYPTRTVQYYIFADPSDSSGGGVGFVVRNKVTRRVVYNSSNKYLRVLGFVSGYLGLEQSSSLEYPGKKVALMQCFRPHAVSNMPSGSTQQPIFVILFRGGVMRTLGDSKAFIDFRVIGTATGFGSVSYYQYVVGDYAYVSLDVTGY